MAFAKTLGVLERRSMLRLSNPICVIIPLQIHPLFLHLWEYGRRAGSRQSDEWFEGELIS